MNKKIIFSAGGTGGHILPAINLMKHFSEKGYDVLLVTDKRGKNFIGNIKKIKSYVLKTDTTTNKNFLKKIFSLFVIIYSVLKSIIIINKERPSLVFGLGGYVSFPICFASKFFNLPLVIYENNLILGRANKFLSFFSKKIFLSNDKLESLSKKNKVKICKIGAILDKKIINQINFKKKIKSEFFSILVLGGSQGAEIFGQVIPKVINMIKKKGYSIEIKQQCIEKQKNSLIKYYENNNIKNYIFEFEKDVLNLTLSSDLAITRCGASTISELVHTLTPFVAVPLPNSIDNHQYLNAKYYENKGCCWILEQDNFNTNNLFNLIIDKIKNKTKLETIRENMKKNTSGNVYNDVEYEINRLLRKNEN